MKNLQLSIILISGISISIISGIFFFLNPVKEINSTQISPWQELQKYNSSKLTEEQLNSAMQIALSDIQVQQMIDGKPVKLMSYGFDGYLWDPQLNLNINNKTQLVVVVDIPTKKVTKVFTGSPIGECMCSPPALNAHVSVGNRTITTALRLYSNSTMPNNIHYLWFRFFDANTNNTIQHVSFFLTITKNNSTLFRELLHTHTGIFTLQINSINTPFNGTVFFADREAVLNGWVPSNDNRPIIVFAPLFDDMNSTYHINIQMVTIDRDNNIFGETSNPRSVPNFDFYLDSRNQNQILQESFNSKR